MSLYKGKKKNSQQIINRLVEIVKDNNHYLRTCEGCGSIDYVWMITPCHGDGFDHLFCEPCKDDAAIKGLKLCAECPDYEDEYDDEEVLESSNNKKNVQIEAPSTKDKSEDNKIDNLPNPLEKENKEKNKMKEGNVTQTVTNKSSLSNKANNKKELKDFIYKPEHCDYIKIIAYLHDELDQGSFAYFTCEACGWIDDRKTFNPCHPESDHFCCTKCHKEAEEKGLTLCNEECGIAICKNCEELVTEDDKVSCCEDSDYYFCQDCATEFEGKNISLCNLAHPLLGNKVLNISSNMLENKDNISPDNAKVEIPPQPIQSLPEQVVEEYTPKCPIVNLETKETKESANLAEKNEELKIKETEESKKPKTTRLPPLSRTLESYFYKGQPCDLKDQRDILIKYLEKNGNHFYTCELCGLKDLARRFVECHPGSEYYCCFGCKGEALTQEKVLCTEICGIEICRKCEQVVSEREQETCCAGSNFFFCKQCSTSFRKSGVNLCSLVHDLEDENLNKTFSDTLNNGGDDLTVNIVLSNISDDEGQILS